MSERVRSLPAPILAIGILCLPWLFTGCIGEEAKPPANERPRTDHLVEVVSVQPRRISTAHERAGTLRSRRLVRIYCQEEGRITDLPWFEGDRVDAGDVLVRLEDDLVRAELAKASATQRQARLDLKRLEGLIKKRAVSEEALTRARTAVDVAEAEEQILSTRLGYTRITAPFAGVVTERLAEPGDVVSKHTHIMTLSDPASLVTEVPVSELLLPLLEIGDPAQVRIDALSRLATGSFSGRILRIHPDLDPVTRQGIVEVVLDPVPGGARAGQFARVLLETAQVERILVPFSALRRDREGEYVFTLRDGKAKRIPVRSGLRIKGSVELLEGVAPGQQIISRGFLGLSDGKTVKPAATAG